MVSIISQTLEVCLAVCRTRGRASRLLANVLNFVGLGPESLWAVGPHETVCPAAAPCATGRVVSRRAYLVILLSRAGRETPRISQVRPLCLLQLAGVPRPIVGLQPGDGRVADPRRRLSEALADAFGPPLGELRHAFAPLAKWHP